MVIQAEKCQNSNTVQVFTPASLHLTMCLYGEQVCLRCEYFYFFKNREELAEEKGWHDLMGLWAPILEGSINLIALLKYITKTHQA